MPDKTQTKHKKLLKKRKEKKTHSSRDTTRLLLSTVNLYSFSFNHDKNRCFFQLSFASSFLCLYFIGILKAKERRQKNTIPLNRANKTRWAPHSKFKLVRYKYLYLSMRHKLCLRINLLLTRFCFAHWFMFIVGSGCFYRYRYLRVSGKYSLECRFNFFLACCTFGKRDRCYSGAHNENFAYWFSENSWRRKF